MKLSHDEIEFLISQYIDGTANELDRARLDELLATDADARAMLSEYQRLDAVVKNSMPLPEIAWDDLAARIASETAKLDVPVRHYRLRIATWSKIAAVAATFAIVAGAIVKLRPHGPISDIHTGGLVAVSHAPINVQIFAPPPMPAVAAVSDIQVGQPAGFAFADDHAADAVISAPSSIWIASGEGSAQDNEPTPY